MTVSFALYADAGLTIPATSLSVAQATDGNAPAVDRVVYLGSTVALKMLRTSTSPGSTQITLTPTDGSPGSGVEASHIKLALSSAGLDSATGGAPLNLGTTLLSGRENALPIYIRVDTPTLSAATYNDITFTTNGLRQDGY